MQINALVLTRSNLALKLGIFLTLLGIIMPVPIMPAIDIDSSWMFGINQAVAQKLNFGKDIVFTYGPYSSLLTLVYHPATRLLVIISSIYLTFLYWIGITTLNHKVKWQWLLIFLITLIIILHQTIIFSRDTLLFLYPLIVALNCIKIQSIQINYHLKFIFIFLLFSGFGLLPLIKTSFLILCIAIYFLSFIYFVKKQQKILAIICVISPIIFINIFWLISGQAFLSLFDYISSSFDIISGYTDAMNLYGDYYEIFIYLLAVIFLLFTIFLQKTLTNKEEKYFLLLSYAAYCFIAFKAGFVRHDLHAITAGACILIASLSLVFIFQLSKTVIISIILSLISWFSIDNHYLHTSARDILNNFYNTYWFVLNFEEHEKLNERFNSSVQAIKNNIQLPLLSGTSDIYSFEQTLLIVSGNIWSPRPILQSYSTYTPKLAEINKQHLLSDNAPNIIFFSVEPIDERLPATEDGLSLPTLLSHYHPIGLFGNYFLMLQKNVIQSSINETVKEQRQLSSLGQITTVPQLSEAVFVKLDIKPTILGHLANFIFKSAPLQIEVNLTNGDKKTYRLISGMAKAGFILSPLIENTSDFIKLYGDKNFLLDKTVKSFSVTTNNRNLWQEEYVVQFSPVSLPTAINVNSILPK